MSKFHLKTGFFTWLLGAFWLLAAHYPPMFPDTDQDLAQVIYDKLQEAIGDKEARWPKLIVWSVENRGAVFVPGENTIYLDEKLITSCRTFGAQMADALSFVIAHEMTHFYQSHHWKESGLVRNFMISSEAFELNRQHEAQADIYGAFISYQAGYNTLRLIPDLLDRIYENYRLDSNENDQYPSLEQRKDLARESCDLAGHLIEIYQMANYLLVLGKFDAAYPLYKHIEQNIQFKELHYNIGICNMMAYLHLQHIDLKYPLLIDSWSPIKRGLINRSPEELLNGALTSFERITQKYDPSYWPAKIQLISIFDWSGEIERAWDLVNIFDRISEINSNDQYLLTKANFLARQGQVVKSRALYQSILNSTQPDGSTFKELIEYNLAILREETPDKQAPKNYPIKNEKDLDGVSSLVFYRDFQHLVQIQTGLQFRYSQEYNSTVSKLEFGSLRFVLQRATTPEIKISGQLGIGSSLAAIEDQFPQEVVSTWQDIHGSFIILYQRGLIFRLNKSGIVEEWVSFSI